MAWEWKIIGMGLGAAVGGPVGAGLGALVGHMFDSFSEEKSSSDSADGLVIMIGCFLGRFATDTNCLNTKECQLIADICSELSPTSKISREVLIDSLYKWAKNDQLFSQVMHIAAQSEDSLKQALLIFAWRVASIDNNINDAKKLWIAAAAEAIGISPRDFSISMIPYYRSKENDSSISEARNILGITSDATLQDIKNKYWELSRKYHPDRYPNVDNTLKELAAERFAKISKAYETLLKALDIKYWGISINNPEEIFIPDDNDIVECFFCHQMCRLPKKENFESARCPKCQALLLFEREIALALLGRHKGRSNDTDTGEKTTSTVKSSHEEDNTYDTIESNIEITRDTIKELVGNLRDSRLFLSPDIPKDILSTAIMTYGFGVSSSDVILLYDGSLDGIGDEGIMITKDSICFLQHGGSHGRIYFSEVESVSYKNSFLGKASLSINNQEIDIIIADDPDLITEVFSSILCSITKVKP